MMKILFLIFIAVGSLCIHCKGLYRNSCTAPILSCRWILYAVNTFKSEHFKIFIVHTGFVKCNRKVVIVEIVAAAGEVVSACHRQAVATVFCLYTCKMEHCVECCNTVFNVFCPVGRQTFCNVWEFCYIRL